MTRFDRVALAAAIAAATFLRFTGIEARGRFDADQGHDMLTLLRFTREGLIPLLGPKTSVGEFHHGAFYYFLLAPSAAISNADPVVVTSFVALLGIAAVALTWWLGRAIGGPVAGAIAGLLLAVSPAAIEESIFIWNPNPIGFFAVLALAAAWRARSGGRSAWWALSLASAGAVVQLHVLGIVFFVAILALVLLEPRRDRAVVPPLLTGLAVVALLFVPLLAHELQTNFAETRAVLDYIRGGDEPLTANPLLSLFFTLLRVVGWTFVGLVTDVPAAAAVLLALTLGLAVLGLRLVPEPRRSAVRWLLAILAWSTLVLAFAAPSLQRVVPGLPNDHYHAFLDPVVVLLVAVPLGILFERSIAAWRSTRRPIPAIATGAAALAIVTIVATSIARTPPPIDPDGGWPAMRDAGARLSGLAPARPMYVVGLPAFKLPDAVVFPVIQAGGTLALENTILAGASGGETDIVVACDRLFETAIGAACGGPAEDALIREMFASDPGGPQMALADRFDASPRTAISVYRRRSP